MSHWILVRFLRLLTTILCRIDARALCRVPNSGPLILVTNHINILEIPVLYTHLQPRPISGYFAAYRMKNLWLRWLLTTFGGIPVERGRPDRSAMRQAVERLRQGDIFALAPEGTRSKDGRLRRGHAGVVLLALETGAPVLPLAFWGSENWQRNLKRLRRTPFEIAVGQPFRIKPAPHIPDRAYRQAVVDEIMVQLAELLPPEYRGEYADAPTDAPLYLEFIPADRQASSNAGQISDRTV